MCIDWLITIIARGVAIIASMLKKIAGNVNITRTYFRFQLAFLKLIYFEKLKHLVR